MNAVFKQKHFYPQLISRIVSLRQDRQCTYNVTMKRVRTTIVAAEKQLVSHIMSVCL